MGPGPPSEKQQRFGIMRTFHHKMYETEPCHVIGSFQQMMDLFCVKHKMFCLFTLIAVSVMVAGILCMVYGYMIPDLYDTLGHSESGSGHIPLRSFVPRKIDEDKQKADQNAFLLSGLVLLIFGTLSVSIGICYPLYRYKKKSDYDDDPSSYQSPIVVEYELPPYHSYNSDNSLDFYGSSNNNSNDVSPNIPRMNGVPRMGDPFLPIAGSMELHYVQYDPQYDENDSR